MAPVLGDPEAKVVAVSAGDYTNAEPIEAIQRFDLRGEKDERLILMVTKVRHQRDKLAPCLGPMKRRGNSPGVQDRLIEVVGRQMGVGEVGYSEVL